MVSFNWVIVLPKGLTAEQFDEWYLGVHTKYAKVAHGIKRYSINRALAEQPAAATGEVFRVAQEYWDDWDTMVECWNSATGHTLLGDGQVNMGLDPGTLPGIALTEEVQLEVTNPARFSTIQRGYRDREDGTITKFVAMGLAKDGDSAGIGDWYRGRFAGLGEDPRLGEHVFGTTVGRTIPVGLLSSLPTPDQTSYDWNLEMWFASNADARAFLESEPFTAMWSELTDASTETVSALLRGQEMLVQNDALPHRDD
jgi:hypothetical protein